MTTPKTHLKAQLHAHGLKPRKSLGQNFLVDPLTAREIVDAAGVGPGDAVVEIGPGLGALTLPLLERTGRLICVELDGELIPALRAEVAGAGELEIIQADAVKLDYVSLAERLGGPLHLVSNLPYQISSPLLFRILDQRAAFRRLTLMFQREVARRLVATPGGKDYGILSVLCQVWADVAPVLEVGPEAFHPPPKVDSAVVQLTIRDEPAVPIGDPKIFKEVTQAAFGQRRKTLRNAIKALGGEPDSWLARAGIDGRRRGETLELAEFAALAAAVAAARGEAPAVAPDRRPDRDPPEG